MSTPTDPYSSSARRPFDEEDILEPITPSPSASSPASSSFLPPASPSRDSALERPVGHEGMDPAFDTDPVPDPPAASTEPATSSEGAAEYGEPSPYSQTLAGSSLALSDSWNDQPSTPEAPAGQPTVTTSPSFQEMQQTGNFAAPEDPWAAPEPPRSAAVPVPEAPSGRGWTHATALIFTILLVPVAWYLISDASVRLSLVQDNPWDTGTLNLAALGELAGGIAVAAVIWFLARGSSLGVFVTGIIVTLFGALALVLPTFTQDNLLTPIENAIGDFNDFTANLVHHLDLDMGSGRIFIFGAILILTGVVSHSARRRGQKFGVLTTRRSIALGEN